MINVGNQTKAQQKSGNGLVRTVLAFGIVGEYVMCIDNFDHMYNIVHAVKMICLISLDL